MRIRASKYLFFLLLSQVFIIPTRGIKAEFSYTKVSSCAPTVVRFTNSSTRGPGITYIWDFGLGAIVTATDNSLKEQLYLKAGQYKVSLKVSDGVEIDSTSTLITIARGPVAGFTADPVNGCPPMLVNFRSTSKPGDSQIITSLWDFRNGDYRQGSSVRYTYNATGQYDVILKVTDSNGCFSQLESEKIITVADKPRPDFTASDTFACSPPLNISFTNLSKGSSALKYKWDFGNGDTSTEISNSSVYDSIGSYSVRLTATDEFGCSDSLIKKSYITVGYRKGTITVYDARNRIFDKSFICDGVYRFVYSDPNLPDYTWIITDNDKTTTVRGKNTIKYEATGSGKIVVKLIYGKNFYCTDSITVSFIKSYIKAAFSLADTMFCSIPRTINLINSSQNADIISWYLSDSLISHDKITSYNLTGKDLPEETYEQLYSHKINRIKLPIKLVASNGGICFDSVTRVITIAKPLARFMPDKVSGCVPLQVTFSDSSRSVFNIDSYTYSIGSDLVTSFNKTPVNYTITEPGKYDVFEIIKSGDCHDTSHIVRIVAGEKLTPDFTVSPDEVCNSGTVHLSGNISNNSLPGIWRFISDDLFDLSFKTRPDTGFTVYSDNTGFKDISLSVDYNGCISDTLKKNILKIKGPAGSFTESFSCDSSLNYRFKSDINPSTSLIWNIDTSIVYDADSVVYVFPESGDYNVKLTASDAASGCMLEKARIVNVRQVMSDFTLNDTIFCVGDSVLLDAASSVDFINTCYNEGFLWYFGDDSPPRRTFLTSYDHIYTGRGTYPIRLIVSGDNGCTDTSRKVVHVFRPAGSFSADTSTGCLPYLRVTFRNISTDTTIVRWIWNFGDNTSDSTNSISVIHTFTSDKQNTFYPALTVYDSWSCSSTYSEPAELVGINGDFQANNNALCIGEAVMFTPSDAGLMDLYWGFGDGTSSVGSATHTYAAQGLFTVSMAATKSGCRDTVTKENYIYVEKADASFTASDTAYNCYPKIISFIHDNSVNSPGVDFLWTFGNQVLLGRSSDNVNYTFTKPGNHKVQLSVRTLNGCEASRSKNIVITGPDALLSFFPRKLCYNEAVYFEIDSLQNASAWKWLFGDGITSTTNPVTHRYTARGKIIPSIQLVSGTCTAIKVLDTISVSRVQADFKSIDSTYSYCYGTKVNLLNRSLYSNSWNWAVDGVQISTGFDLRNIQFSTTGDHYVRLVAKKTGDCSDTLIKKFTINPLPSFTISGDSIICAGKNSADLSVAGHSGDNIRWTPSEGLYNTTAFNITVRPEEKTTYTARVTNSYGCSSTREKTVWVNQPFDLIRSPLYDTLIYIGQRIQLEIKTTESNVKYKWSPNDKISCIHCSNPWVWPIETTTYTVQAENGCFNISEGFNIEVIRDFYLEAPSAFTPNGDSNNDLFKFEAKNVTSFELKIFNRWGEIVYTTNDINQGWDGNVNGHPQNIDTYKYSVNAVTVHGYKFLKSGEFLLLR